MRENILLYEQEVSFTGSFNLLHLNWKSESESEKRLTSLNFAISRLLDNRHMTTPDIVQSMDLIEYSKLDVFWTFFPGSF